MGQFYSAQRRPLGQLARLGGHWGVYICDGDKVGSIQARLALGPGVA